MFAKVLGWLGKSDSPAGTVTPTDALKAIRSAAIYALSIGGVAFLESVAKIDIGPYGLIAAPILAGAIDYLRRWATDNK
jgi:hypothetical protein